jgi:predicted enzyme related to lactoylglutathione lyase
MKNLISIFEIPAKDFSRAVKFYQAILDISIEKVEMDGVEMGLFPGADNSVSGSVIKGSDYKPSADGVIIYLNGGDDLQVVLDRVEANKGKILVPKTQISPESGFYALFIDTEGNKLGLHSAN